MVAVTLEIKMTHVVQRPVVPARLQAAKADKKGRCAFCKYGDSKSISTKIKLRASSGPSDLD